MAQESTTDLECRLTQAQRELSEARQQQAVTSEILHVISTSSTDAQPVFETIVRNAVSLCGSLFANVFRFDGELLHFVAGHNVGPSYVELLRAKYPMRPDSSQVSGRVLLTKSVVRLEDALADPGYDQRFPPALGWRRMLGVPMLQVDGGLELPPKMVQQRMGHASIAITMDVYGHLFPRGDDGAELAAAEKALLAAI
jgi:hypothetical protein